MNIFAFLAIVFFLPDFNHRYQKHPVSEKVMMIGKNTFIIVQKTRFTDYFYCLSSSFDYQWDYLFHNWLKLKIIGER